MLKLQEFFELYILHEYLLLIIAILQKKIYSIKNIKQIFDSQLQRQYLKKDIIMRIQTNLPGSSDFIRAR